MIDTERLRESARLSVALKTGSDFVIEVPESDRKTWKAFFRGGNPLNALFSAPLIAEGVTDAEALEGLIMKQRSAIREQLDGLEKIGRELRAAITNESRRSDA